MQKTFREMADDLVAKGQLNRTYNYALPQQWVDAVHEETGIWPQTLGFVWEYLPNAIWGRPFPLKPEANALLTILPERFR